MSPAEVIRDATADGVFLTVSTTGKIKASGNEESIDRWLTLISEHKPGILEALQPTAELQRLVRLCGEFYGFTEAEHVEALAVALADFDCAMLCFSTMEAEIQVGNKAHPDASPLPGNATTSPASHESSRAHPGRRAA